MRNLFQYVGLRHLQKKPTRTLLTTLGVALGVALYVAIDLINKSTLSSFNESINALAGKASITISAGEAGFPEEKLEIITQTQGVAHAVPMIESRAYFTDIEGKSQTLMILGVDLLKEQAVRTYKTSDEQIIDDPLTFLNQPDSIIVSHAFAKKHHLEIDSPFSMATVHGQKKFTVRGLLSPDGPAKAYGGSMAIMDIDGARFTFAKEGKIDRVDIVTQTGITTEDLISRLQQGLGLGYTVERPQTQGESMERMVKGFQMMLKFFSTLALLVGIFLVSNSVSIAVAERKKEIGTLRALGATRFSVMTVFLSEAIAMGALGALGGAFLGRALAGYMVGMVAKSMSSQYLTKIEVATIQFSMADVYHGVLIGTLAAFFAALWPSYRSTTVDPLEAMKRRDVGERATSGFLKYAPWIGSTLLILMTTSSFFQLEQKIKAFETINQMAAMIGAALVAPTIVAYLIRWTKPLTKNFGGTILRLSQDNLLRNPMRTGNNVMSLMIGLMLVILVAGVNVSFKKTIMSWFNKVLYADLFVSSSGRVISDEVQPLDENLAAEINKVPGVVIGPYGGAFGVRYTKVRYNGELLGLKAYDIPDPSLNYKIFDVVDRPVPDAGKELFFSNEDTVMISKNFSLHFNKKSGDYVDIDTPAGRKSMKVVGIVTDFASPRGIIYMARKNYSRYWNDHLVSVFGMRVVPGFDPQKVRSDIDQMVAASRGLIVISNTDMRSQMTSVIDQSFSYSRAIEAAALLVGLLGLLNTLLISVMERFRELGMLRAVGMSKGQLFRMILQESLFQGGFGAIAAAILGCWITYLWIQNSLAHVLGWIVEFHFPWTSVIMTVSIGLIVALIAGFIPSRRAANLDIREALEYE